MESVRSDRSKRPYQGARRQRRLAANDPFEPRPLRAGFLRPAWRPARAGCSGRVARAATTFYTSARALRELALAKILLVCARVGPGDHSHVHRSSACHQPFAGSFRTRSRRTAPRGHGDPRGSRNPAREGRGALGSAPHRLARAPAETPPHHASFVRFAQRLDGPNPCAVSRQRGVVLPREGRSSALPKKLSADVNLPRGSGDQRM